MYRLVNENGHLKLHTLVNWQPMQWDNSPPPLLFRYHASLIPILAPSIIIIVVYYVIKGSMIIYE